MNNTTSPIANLVDDNITASTSVADTLPTICATAPVMSPNNNSPNTLWLSNDNPDGKTNLSKVGAKLFKDSNTPIIFTASGLFKDISLSSTLNP